MIPEEQETTGMDHLEQLADTEANVDVLNRNATEQKISDPALSRRLAGSAIEMAKRLDYAIGEADAHLCLGDLHRFARYTDAAFRSYRAALDIYEGLSDRAGMAKVYNAIGMCNKNTGRYKEAIDWYNKAMAVNKATDNIPWLSVNLANLGVVYECMGNWPQTLEYYQQAIGLIEQLLRDNPDDKGFLSRKASYLHNMGTVYLRMEEFGTSISFLQAGIDIRAAHNELDGLASGYINLAGAYLGLKDFEKAEEYIERGLDYAGKCDAVHWQQIGSQLAIDIFEALGHLPKALHHAKLRTMLVMDMNKRESNASMAEMLTRFDLERKEAEAELHRVRSVELQGALDSVKAEKRRSEELLRNILPRQTIREMLQNGKVMPRHYGSATVLFTDFENFTTLTAQTKPEDLVSQLNVCFSAFDRIAEQHGLEKIKTIGDSYMAAGGVPLSSDSHAVDCVKAALEMVKCIRVIGGSSFRIRIGIHSGPVVAGIVGIRKFQYDIWGDTVNTASRMESSGEVGKVNISEATYELVKDHFNCEYRGEIEAKGKGKLGMYFVRS